MINLEDDANEFSFVKHIKNYVIDRLDSLQGTSCYGSDLVSHLMEEDNINGAIYVATADNISFIREHWDEAGAAYQYAKEEFDMDINPFAEPEQMVFMMYELGINELINGNSNFIEEHWDDEIELNESNINIIKKELGLPYDETKIIEDEEMEEE